MPLGDLENDQKLEEQLNVCREKLYYYREKRIHPFKDDKILTSWNGLMMAVKHCIVWCLLQQISL